MTTSNDRHRHDARQSDALEAFLNGFVRDDRSPSDAVDPALARTAAELQAMADATVAANIDPGSEARTWEALMRTGAARPRIVAHPAVARPSLSQTVIAGPPSRLRRVGDQSLGLVATLTLVALIGLSGLAVYLAAPQGDDPGTAAALVGASQTIDATPAAPLDARVVRQMTCTAAPQDYDTLMSTIWDEALRILPQSEPDQIRVLTSPVTVTADAAVLGGFVFTLPDGAAPDAATIDAVINVFGMLDNCGSLEQASLSTIDRYVRLTLDQTGGSGSSVPFIALWRDAQGREPEHPSGNAVGPPRYQLYGFRMLDDMRLGAYIARAGDLVVTNQDCRYEIHEPQFDQRGYITFERQDGGRWLIDRIAYPVPEDPLALASMCATPAT